MQIIDVLSLISLKLHMSVSVRSIVYLQVGYASCEWQVLLVLIILEQCATLLASAVFQT